MPIITIFLDLDDTLNRFTMPALAYVGCNVNLMTYDDYNPAWGYDIVKAANALLPFPQQMSNMEFWRRLDQCFWANLPESDEMDFLISQSTALVGEENVCILTNPRSEPGCIPGKRAWIRDHLPKWIHEQVLIGRPKHFCAQPRALLIDDYDKNVYKFRKKNGQAILIPRPWNSLYKVDTMEHLIARFENLREKIT